jgi:hypothetical protein
MYAKSGLDGNPLTGFTQPCYAFAPSSPPGAHFLSLLPVVTLSVRFSPASGFSPLSSRLPYHADFSDGLFSFWPLACCSDYAAQNLYSVLFCELFCLPKKTMISPFQLPRVQYLIDSKLNYL